MSQLTLIAIDLPRNVYVYSRDAQLYIGHIPASKAAVRRIYRAVKVNQGKPSLLIYEAADQLQGRVNHEYFASASKDAGKYIDIKIASQEFNSDLTIGDFWQNLNQDISKPYGSLASTIQNHLFFLGLADQMTIDTSSYLFNDPDLLRLPLAQTTQICNAYLKSLDLKQQSLSELESSRLSLLFIKEAGNWLNLNQNHDLPKLYQKTLAAIKKAKWETDTSSKQAWKSRTINRQ